MFGLFKKDPSKQRPEEEYERTVTQHYEGSVISSDYNVNAPDEYPYQSLYPHGFGKIVYTFSGEVVESYEGEFKGGQYSGKGRLVRKDSIFEGSFKDNKFLDE